MGSPWVVDASVIEKWVIPPDDEPWQGQAGAIFSAARQGLAEICAPSLWHYEVGNILARKFPSQAPAQLAALSVILGEGYPTTDTAWRVAALDLTARYRVTFYDASYHALAIVLDGVFVTADEKYLQATDSESHIMHIKDWTS